MTKFNTIRKPNVEISKVNALIIRTPPNCSFIDLGDSHACWVTTTLSFKLFLYLTVKVCNTITYEMQIRIHATMSLSLIFANALLHPHGEISYFHILSALYTSRSIGKACPYLLSRPFLGCNMRLFRYKIKYFIKISKYQVAIFHQKSTNNILI